MKNRLLLFSGVLALVGLLLAPACSAENTERKPPMKILNEKLELTCGGETFSLELYDNPTTRSLMAQLPLELTFRDYAGEEKIADPPNALSQQDAPDGYAPEIGELTCYGPWGNLAVFYRKHAYGRGLIPMGRFESGIERFSARTGEFRVKLVRKKP